MSSFHLQLHTYNEEESHVKLKYIFKKNYCKVKQEGKEECGEQDAHILLYFVSASTTYCLFKQRILLFLLQPLSSSF